MNIDYLSTTINGIANAAIAAYDTASTTQLALTIVACLVSVCLLLGVDIFVLAAIAFIGYAYYVATAAAAIASLIFVFVYIAYTYWVFTEWEKAFAGHRLTRRNEACPSNQQMPDVKSFHQNKDHIIEVSSQIDYYCCPLSSLQ